MSIKSYLIQPLVATLLIVSITVIILALFILIRRRNANKILSSNYSMNLASIKDAKRLIYKYKLKNKICGLHILAESAPEELHINNIVNDYEVINLSSGVSIGIKDGNLSLLAEELSIKAIEEIKSKLKLNFASINLHYEISNSISYNDELIIEANKIKTRSKTANIILNFYSYSSDYNTDEFNRIIGKNNLYKLKNDNINEFFTTISSNIIKSKNDSTIKHSCISIISSIYKVVFENMTELGTTKSNVYAFMVLNKQNCLDQLDNISDPIYHKYTHIKSIFISILSLLISALFILNIFTEIELKKSLKLSLASNTQLAHRGLSYDVGRAEYRVDEKIWLASIYPDDIKYRHIRTMKARLIGDKIFIPEMSKVKSNFIMTNLLIYLAELNNNLKNIDNEDSNTIIEIISKVTNIRSDDLITLLKYSDKDTKQKLIRQAKKIIGDFYYEAFDKVYDNLSTFMRYEKAYIGISDSHRSGTVYKALEESSYRCTTQTILSKLKTKRNTPASFLNAFASYTKHNSESKMVCNNLSTEIITSSLHDIDNTIHNSKAESFQEFISTLGHIVSNLENRENSLKQGSVEYKTLHPIMPVLIRYAASRLTYNTYDSKSLPLLAPLDDSLFISFSPTFTKGYIKLSPLYSKISIDKDVTPLMEQVNDLIKKLNKQYKLNTEFIESIYRNATKSFYGSYVTSFDNAAKSLYENKIILKDLTNENSLSLYLDAMSSESSEINNFLTYFKTNISVKSIQLEKSFEKDANFLSSKDYSNYRNIFSQLTDMINDKGYSGTYAIIKNKYKPLDNVYHSLSNLNSSKHNYLYRALKFKIDIAVNAIEFMATKNTVNALSIDIGSDYDYINSFQPLSYSSNKTLSNKDLTSYIGDAGSIYSELQKSLTPLLTYNKIKKQWYNDSFETSKQKRILTIYNKISSLNNLLWDKYGKSQKIKLEITPIPSDDNNYVFASILINQNQFVNSLNIKYYEPLLIPYGWGEQDPISITLKLEDGSTVQKEYVGDWALLKAMKDAKCVDNICTWQMSHKGVNYPVSFKIESEFIDIIKN